MGQLRTSMKIKDVIKHLQKCNPESELYFRTDTDVYPISLALYDSAVAAFPNFIIPDETKEAFKGPSISEPQFTNFEGIIKGYAEGEHYTSSEGIKFPSLVIYT